MSNFIEIKPPLPKPRTYQQYLQRVAILLRELEKPYPMPIDNKITNFEKQCLEKSK